MADGKHDDDLEDELELELEDDSSEGADKEDIDEAGEGEPAEPTDAELAKLAGEDVDDPDSDAKSAKEAEIEAKRERRRREKKMRNDKRRLKEDRRDQLLADALKKIKALEEGGVEIYKNQQENTLANIDNEINDLGRVYRNAQDAEAKAIDAGDGAAAIKAREIANKAIARYNQLDGQKKVIKSKTETDTPFTKTDIVDNTRSGNDNEYSATTVNHGKQWMLKNKAWYDGKNRDSKLVLTLDRELVEEGYNPDEKEYWDELTDRAKEVLPHRFKSASRPKSIVGGSERDGGSPNRSEAKVTLPKEFMANLNRAYGDDQVKRKAAIKDYLAQQRKGA